MGYKINSSRTVLIVRFCLSLVGDGKPENFRGVSAGDRGEAWRSLDAERSGASMEAHPIIESRSVRTVAI